MVRNENSINSCINQQQVYVPLSVPVCAGVGDISGVELTVLAAIKIEVKSARIIITCCLEFCGHQAL